MVSTIISGTGIEIEVYSLKKSILMPTATASDIQTLSIDTVRVLSADAVQKANSGHPGTPMATAPMGFVLWTKHMRYNPK
ncbi:MAG TPA: hypothetical protein VHW43_06165, partial [Puia sp.]|nr:hypothetical protein [Puia sp.]